MEFLFGFVTGVAIIAVLAGVAMVIASFKYNQRQPD